MHQITLTASQNVLMNHIKEHSYVNVTVFKFAPLARAHDPGQSRHCGQS